MCIYQLIENIHAISLIRFQRDCKRERFCTHVYAYKQYAVVIKSTSETMNNYRHKSIKNRDLLKFLNICCSEKFMDKFLRKLTFNKQANT